VLDFTLIIHSFITYINKCVLSYTSAHLGTTKSFEIGKIIREIDMMLLNEKTFKAETSGSALILVDFYADWCGPCRMLGPVLEELSNDKTFVGKLKFSKLSTETYPELAEKNNVQGIPCMIFFKNGKEVNRIVGFAPKPVMKAKINTVLESVD
jgi:thioredoxin 1